MWYVYILHSLKDNKHYIGHTSDLTKRMVRHNSGGNVSTRWRRPLELVYYEEYNTKRESVARELKIKSWKGGGAFKKLLK